jgi:hypothetical protein
MSTPTDAPTLPEEAAAVVAASPPGDGDKEGGGGVAMGEAHPQERQQRWVPLEANPDVFTSFARRLGLPKDSAHFVDVYGLDEVKK